MHVCAGQHPSTHHHSAGHLIMMLWKHPWAGQPALSQAETGPCRYPCLCYLPHRILMQPRGGCCRLLSGWQPAQLESTPGHCDLGNVFWLLGSVWIITFQENNSSDISGGLRINFSWKCGLHIFPSARIFCIWLPVVTVCFCIFSCICSTFYETHIPHHAYLSWILCICPCIMIFTKVCSASLYCKAFFYWFFTFFAYLCQFHSLHIQVLCIFQCMIHLLHIFFLNIFITFIHIICVFLAVFAYFLAYLLAYYSSSALAYSIFYHIVCTIWCCIFIACFKFVLCTLYILVWSAYYANFLSCFLSYCILVFCWLDAYFKFGAYTIAYLLSYNYKI